MVQVITVAPIADGWSVKHDVADNASIFKSGAKAEAAARQLGGTLARLGEAAEIRIYLRDGSLGGRFVVPPIEQAMA